MMYSGFFAAKFSNFLENTRGNVAIFLALGATVVIGAAGLAIDYVRAQDMRTRLAGFADASALSAISAAALEKSGSEEAIIAKGKSEALRLWNSNVALTTDATVNVPEIELSKAGGSWTSKVTYSGQLKTNFISFLGFEGVKVSGDAVASNTVGSSQHWNFILAVDTSSSMGIGATQNDMDRMQADPNIGCMFACHFNSSGGTVSYAQQQGYKLRLDVVSDAVDSAMDQLEKVNGLKPEVSVLGLTTTVTELVPMTDNLQRVKDHHIQIASVGISEGNTNLRAVTENLTTIVGKSGDGSSSSNPKKVVIMITDGIHDTIATESNVVLNPGMAHFLGPIDPAFCKALKDNGNVVGVLYINYITPRDYIDWIEPWNSSVLPSLQSCASENMFVNASDSSSIEAGLQTLIQASLKSQIRLTQ